MNRHAILCALLCVAAGCSSGTDELRRLADRAAIHEVMQKYVWSVDSLDADGYASVFTEDAVIDSNGNLSQGHEAIRGVVTGLLARQAANREAGRPPGNLYHVISNETIAFQSDTEATYQSYWQTMRRNEEGRYIAGGFGRSEDHLVKQGDGRWLIRHRKLVVFTD
jgi:uncharacterized protein (TIGR02246 family)